MNVYELYDSDKETVMAIEQGKAYAFGVTGELCMWHRFYIQRKAGDSGMFTSVNGQEQELSLAQVYAANGDLMVKSNKDDIFLEVYGLSGHILYMQKLNKGEMFVRSMISNVCFVRLSKDDRSDLIKLVVR